MNVFGGFNSSKLKPQLKMACSRIQIASNKKSALLKQNMREIAMMLAEDPPKEEKAKIRAEALIRDDNIIEAYEILQLQCELLHERIKLLEYSKDCPSDLIPVVSTLMWAAHRVDIPELLEIRKQFKAKYGKQFDQNALADVGNILNERVVTKLSVHPPAAYLVQIYLERICEHYEVDWTPRVKLSTNEMVEPMAAPVGYSVQVAQGTGLGAKAISGLTDFGTVSEEGSRANPPPMATATPMPPVTKKDEDDENNGGGGGGNIEIYVPGAPSAPSSTTPTVSTLQSPTTGLNGGGGGQDAGGGTQQAGARYEDLAARFQQLK